MTYFLVIIFIQGVYINAKFDQHKKVIIANNFYEVVLLYDITFFYFTILAMMIFNVLIRLRKYHTIKERMIGKIERFKAINGDSFFIAKEDLHYITITFSRICLFIFVENNRHDNTKSEPLRFFVLLMNIVNLFFIYIVFFAADENNVIMDSSYRKFRVPLGVLASLVICFMEISFLVRNGEKT